MRNNSATRRPRVKSFAPRDTTFRKPSGSGRQRWRALSRPGEATVVAVRGWQGSANRRPRRHWRPAT